MSHTITMNYNEDGYDTGLYKLYESHDLPHTEDDYFAALDIALEELKRRGEGKYILEGKLTINGAVNSYYGLAGKNLKGKKRTIVIPLDRYNAITVHGDD